MRRTALLAALVVAALAVLAAVGGSSAAGRDRPAASGFRLKLFESCDELLSYARENTLRIVGPYGLPSTPLYPRATQFERSKRGADYSSTNVQEDGIDEPDVVKTNGKHLFTVQRTQVRAVAIEDRRDRSGPSAAAGGSASRAASYVVGSRRRASSTSFGGATSA
jgi:uncharacterized secreted protein with C-terminal beta-propeller domain